MQAHTMKIPRCGASLRLCDSTPCWQCLVCHRRYTAACFARDRLPDCLFCALRLAPSSLHPQLLGAPGLA